MDIIVFDIETIPQKDPLTDSQTKYLEKRLLRALGENFTDHKEYDETRRRIMGTSPFLGEIICIGIKKVLGNGKYDAVALTGKESDILTRWWGIVSKHSGQYVHYNGLGFDVPWIIKRSIKHGIRPTSKDFLDLRRYQKYPHFDVQMIIADWDRFNVVSLDLVCDLFSVPSPKKGVIKAKDVEKAYNEGKIDDISAYCLRDVDSTYKVYKLLSQYIKF